MRIRPNKSLVDAYYLLQYCNSREARKAFMQNAKTTTMTTIDQVGLGDVEIPLPPLPEQRKIATILRTWDEAIEKLEKLALAKQQRLNHLTVLLFQYSEKHGKRKIFGDFLTESSVAGATGENAKKITVKLYGKGVFAKKERNVGSASTRYYVRRYGQLIYSKLDFLNGAFGIIPKVLDGYESTQDLPAFDISPSINPQWLLAYLTRESFYSSCVSLARGQRKARRINPSDFLEMPLKVPSKDAQDRIAETLAYARYDLEHTNQQKSLIQSQKRGLMQKLLTGEWRVEAEQEASSTNKKEKKHVG
jgi:type I restriction enzyme S subunit